MGRWTAVFPPPFSRPFSIRVRRYRQHVTATSDSGALELHDECHQPWLGAHALSLVGNGSQHPRASLVMKQEFKSIILRQIFTKALYGPLIEKKNSCLPETKYFPKLNVTSYLCTNTTKGLLNKSDIQIF